MVVDDPGSAALRLLFRSKRRTSFPERLFRQFPALAWTDRVRSGNEPNVTYRPGGQAAFPAELGVSCIGGGIDRRAVWRACLRLRTAVEKGFFFTNYYITYES